LEKNQESYDGRFGRMQKNHNFQFSSNWIKIWQVL